MTLWMVTLAVLGTACAPKQHQRVIVDDGEDDPQWRVPVDEQFVEDTFGPTALEQCRDRLTVRYTCSAILGPGLTLVANEREVWVYVTPAGVRRGAPEAYKNRWRIHCSAPECPLDVPIADVPP